MEVSKYNQMMAYLTRPRERFENGGKVFNSKELAKKLGFEQRSFLTAIQRYPRFKKFIDNFFTVTETGDTKKKRSFELKKDKNFSQVKKGFKEYQSVKPITISTKEDIRNFIRNSKGPVTYTDVVKKFPNVPKDTIKGSLRDLRKEKEFKGKLPVMGIEEKVKIQQATKSTKRAPILNTIRDVFVQDPDADVEDIAKAMVGTKKYNAAKGTALQAKYLKDAKNQVANFVSIFSKGAKTVIPNFKDINPNKLGEILESIESRIDDFGFESGIRREVQFAIADAKRGLPEKATLSTVAKLRQPGKAVDEVVGVSATFDKAPGYIEATQVIDENINKLKAKQIDNPFSREFKKVLDGDYSGYKEYNKKARAFAKKYKVDVPIIKIGEDLQPEKFVSNFTDFSPEAQKNIKQIAKDKGVVIQTKSKPLFSFSELGGDTAKYLAALGCPGKAMGGRIEFQTGGAPTQECIARGAEKINNPSLIKGGAEARNASQFLNRAYKLGRNVVKFGVIPEAIFVAGESLVRMGMGDTLNESLLRATDYLLPGNQTRKADQLKFDRTLDKETSDIILKAQDYKKSIEQLNTAKSNLKTNQDVIDGSDFSYTGNVDALERQKLDEQIIKSAEQNVKNKYVPEAVTAFATVKEAEAQDIASSNSPILKAIQNAKSAEVDDFETLFTPEKKQEGVAPPMFTMDDIADIAVTDTQLQRAKDELGGAPEYTKRNLFNFNRQVNEDYNNAVLDLIFAEGEKNLANRERLFGTQSLFGGAPIIDTPNRGQSSYIQSPFQREEENKLIEEGARFGAAGGGIMKLAGIDKGPQITSMNPDSGGLASLQKNVKKL